MFLILSKLQEIKPFRSDANFVFFESFDLYNSIQEELSHESISIKALGDFCGYNGCYRVTVGTQEMNDRFIGSMRKIMTKDR
jgi:histidinol-phosphate aminotransferase